MSFWNSVFASRPEAPVWGRTLLCSNFVGWFERLTEWIGSMMRLLFSVVEWLWVALSCWLLFARWVVNASVLDAEQVLDNDWCTCGNERPLQSERRRQPGSADQRSQTGRLLGVRSLRLWAVWTYRKESSSVVRTKVSKDRFPSCAMNELSVPY